MLPICEGPRDDDFDEDLFAINRGDCFLIQLFPQVLMNLETFSCTVLKQHYIMLIQY